MLKKQYIFESSSTRLKRYFINVFLLGLLAFCLYSIFCVLFILVSERENKAAEQALFNRPPDLIVVFTGDQGRIPFALNKAKEYRQSKIFITGVYSKNSVQTLLKPLELGNEFDPNFLDIDYLARNTVENVIATLHYLREHRSLKNVLIISHDYHIMRIKLIVNRLKAPNDQFDFHYQGVKTNYNSIRNLRVLYTEVFKLARTYLFLLLWDVDTGAVT